MRVMNFSLLIFCFVLFSTSYSFNNIVVLYLIYEKGHVYNIFYVVGPNKYVDFTQGVSIFRWAFSDTLR